jgi:hypothetical protein
MMRLDGRRTPSLLDFGGRKCASRSITAVAASFFSAFFLYCSTDRENGGKVDSQTSL